MTDLFCDEDLTTPVNKLCESSRKLAAVCMALASDANVIFLEEPCTGLDKNSKKELLNLIKLVA